jgi:hypothetical protein
VDCSADQPGFGREAAMKTASDPSRTPAQSPRCLRTGAWMALSAALTVWLTGGPALAQSVPWGWDSAGPARAVWTPQNLADYLLTGQTPHPAVARIIAPESSSTSLGSGVLVDVNRSQGLVLTNWHVVRDSRSAVLVQFPDGFQSAGTVIRWDEAWDLAALVIWKPRATPVPIAARPPALGEILTIAGFGRGPYREESGPCLDYLSPSTGYPREFVELKANWPACSSVRPTAARSAAAPRGCRRFWRPLVRGASCRRRLRSFLMLGRSIAASAWPRRQSSGSPAPASCRSTDPPRQMRPRHCRRPGRWWTWPCVPNRWQLPRGRPPACRLRCRCPAG